MPGLRIDISSYWITATGKSGGFAVDSETLLDADGLPFLPGRHVKGLLRDAFRRAGGGPVEEQWLFGNGVFKSHRDRETGRALIEVRDARLPAALRSAILSNGDLRQGLFRKISSTALNDSGVALDHSLRVLRVAVPMTLEAEVALDPAADFGNLAEAGQKVMARWRDLIGGCLPFVEAVGGGRRHGFGRAWLEWTQ